MQTTRTRKHNIGVQQNNGAIKMQFQSVLGSCVNSSASERGMYVILMTIITTVITITRSTWRTQTSAKMSVSFYFTALKHDTDANSRNSAAI